MDMYIYTYMYTTFNILLVQVLLLIFYFVSHYFVEFIMFKGWVSTLIYTTQKSADWILMNMPYMNAYMWHQL